MDAVSKLKPDQDSPHIDNRVLWGGVCFSLVYTALIYFLENRLEAITKLPDQGASWLLFIPFGIIEPKPRLDTYNEIIRIPILDYLAVVILAGLIVLVLWVARKGRLAISNEQLVKYQQLKTNN